MLYLKLLFVIAGIVTLVLAVVLGASYGFGAYLNSRNGTRADPANTDPCAQCQADRDWYDGLPGSHQILVTAWWLVNRYLWTEKGCQ